MKLTEIYKDNTSKPEIEQVEQKKQEYKLIGKFLRRKGLRLYAYSSMKNELKEVEIDIKDQVHVTTDEDGKLAPVDLGLEEAEVDLRNIHFEALNWKNAENRLRKFKSGLIKDLCNLRISDPESIKLF